MTAAPDELSQGEQALADWGASHDYREPASEEQFQAREYDEWFREVADPTDVVERDRRLAEAGRDMSDAFEVGDMVRFDISHSIREQAFWALPADEHVDAGAHYDVATYDAGATDDDADGWY